jgi:hypothetical protein
MSDIIRSPAERAALQLIPQESGWRVPTLLRAHPTSLDVSTVVGECNLINATGPPDLTFDECDGQTFHVRDYVVWTSQSVDEETGEVREHPRTTLIDNDGRTLQTTSEFVPHRLALLIGLRGPGTFDPPVPITVIRRQSRRKGRFYHDIKFL